MKAHQDLLALVRSAKWKAEDKEDQADAVRTAVTKARRLAKRSLFESPVRKAKPSAAADPWAEFPAVQ